MANLVIRGHATRGKEVIEILEMLGGRNASYSGLSLRHYYYINECGYVTGTIEISNNKTFIIYTLEEFLEKFPYKIGDKVFARGSAGEITDMKWQGDSFFTTKEEGEVVYTVILDTEEEITFSVEDLRLYKEETFGECIAKTIDICLFGEQEKMEEQIKIDIPKGYEIASIDANQVLLKKVESKYPKTYEECCKVLNISKSSTLYVESESKGTVTNCAYSCSLVHKLGNFRKLLICRDAYWKLAENWKPNWSDNNIKYIITIAENKIYTDVSYIFNSILSFPTEEMRDRFCENFKSLIEQCKELL